MWVFGHTSKERKTPGEQWKGQANAAHVRRMSALNLASMSRDGRDQQLHVLHGRYFMYMDVCVAYPERGKHI